MDFTPDLTVPMSTTTIDEQAFAGIQNQIVRIPQTTTSIADNAFDETMVILCEAGSDAENWAESNGLTYYIVE